MSDRPQDPERRAALRLLVATGLLPLTAGATGLLSLTSCRGEQNAEDQAFRRVLSDAEGMIATGRAWLNAQPPSPAITIASLLEAIRSPETSQAPTDAELRRWLAERQREDWLLGRVVSLNGVRLTATEVRLYGLAALFAPPRD